MPKEEKNSVIEKNYNKEKIIFNNQIDIKKISFKYPNAKENVIKNLSFTIKKNDIDVNRPYNWYKKSIC